MQKYQWSRCLPLYLQYLNNNHKEINIANYHLFPLRFTVMKKNCPKSLAYTCTINYMFCYTKCNTELTYT